MPKTRADRELQLDALVLQAAALEPDEREQLLENAAREDLDLVEEARRRLAQAESMPASFLAAPIAADPEPTPESASVEKTPPESLGPYRVVRRLGEGGMGEVYEGYDDRLDRPIALKRIRPEAGAHEQTRARFRREARAVARLSHSSIVQVHDWVETEMGDWIVMELVDGRSLRELLTSGPLAPAKAARIAKDIASGLAAAHDSGIVHRDLKAANVMLAGERAKILDFGIAKRLPAGAEETLTSVTTEGKVIGTATAMSPEQAMGRPVDRRSDLFALGALLYEMTTGEPPFRGQNLVETLTHICTRQQTPAIKVNPSVPEALSELMNHLLEKDPAHRPQTAEEVVSALETFASDEPVLRSPTRRRRIVALTAGVILALTAFLVASYLPRREEATVEAGVTTANEDLYSLYQKGLEYLQRYDKQGNLDRAIDTFQRIQARDPSSAAAYAGLAKAYWLQAFSGSRDPLWLEQALPAAQTAIQLDEHLAVARVTAGLVLADLGRVEEAIQELEQARALEPLNAEAHYAFGRIEESLGNLGEAESFYQQAISLGSENWIYPARLGTLYLRAGRYAEAETMFRRGIELAPDNFFGFRNLGVVYYMQDKLAEAATQFQKALQIQSDPSLYMNLGTIYFAQGLYQQSVSVFEKALAIGTASNNYRSWGNLADAYRWTPDNEYRARDAYLRAIQLLQERLAATPQDATLQSRLALFLAKRGDFEEAQEAIEDASRLSGDASSLVRIGVAHELCGNREQALENIEAALVAGYSLSELRRDPELMDFRRDPEFHRLAMRYSSDSQLR